LEGKHLKEEQDDHLIVVMLLISGFAPMPNKEAIDLDWILSKII
jgi:hypothetical protein